MNDLKTLWNLHKNTRIIANILKVHERTVIRHLKDLNITPPSRAEQKKKQLQKWIAIVVPQLIPSAIWMNREQDSSHVNQYDAFNSSTNEKIMVSCSYKGKQGYRFDIEGMKKKADRILLMGIAENRLSFAYYVPVAFIRGNKYLNIPVDSNRFKPYELKHKGFQLHYIDIL